MIDYALMIYAVIIVIIVIYVNVIAPLISKVRNKYYFKNTIVYSNKDFNDNKYREIDISKLNLDINTLKDELYEIFYKLETSYNDLNYNVMRSCSTKELYNNYYTGISLNLRAGLKKVIENITKDNIIIYELHSNDDSEVVSVMLEISYISYTVNKNGYIVNGDRNIKKEKFEVTFIKSLKAVNNNCPNCGAPVTDELCEFCNTQVDNNNYKISQIRKIVD